MPHPRTSSNPIATRSRTAYHESSRLRSLRDADATARQWIRNRNESAQTAALHLSVREIQRQIDRLRILPGQDTEESEAYYPLKIYQSPYDASMTEGEEWLWFRVRAACVLTSDDQVDIAGTDGDGLDEQSRSPNADPDNAGVPAFDTSGTPPIDFKVTSGTVWYVWVDATDPDNPEIGNSNTAPGSWVGDGYLLVGTIDCSTHVATKESVVRQFRRGDVLVVKGCVDGAEGDIPI